MTKREDICPHDVQSNQFANQIVASFSVIGSLAVEIDGTETIVPATSDQL